MRRALLSGSLALVLGPFGAGQSDAWVELPGSEGAGRGRRIVLVSGDEEYRSEEALPQLAKILARHHGFDCRVLFAIDPRTGRIDGEVQTNIPGLEALATADLMVIATRFRDLPDEQMRHIDAYVRSGRPVVGIRTATHAFWLRSSPTFARYSWNHEGGGGGHGFGRQVLGETWIAHHGRHGEQGTRGVIAPGAGRHPITRGLGDGDVRGPTDVYRVRLPLPDGCTPLVLGQVLDGTRPDSPAVVGPQNEPTMPIAWTKVHDGSDFGPRRVFTQTIGAATDFVAEGTRRLFVNGVFWALGLESEVPDSGSHVDLVGRYEPSAFGFGKARLGVRPADHEFGAVARPRGERGLCAPDSRIVVVGNTFAERLAQSGAFDAIAYATHPGRRLVIRHAPWSGDEVGVRPREHSVPTMLDWLVRLDADVAVLCFGMSESFSLTPVEFADGLGRLLDDVERIGPAPPRVVLVSPIAREGAGSMVDAQNEVLSEFRHVMRRIAATREVEFVDLLVDPMRAHLPASTPMTTNGIHPDARACGVFALAIAEQLGWLPHTTDASAPSDVSAVRALRLRTADRHWWFRQRYRPTNTEYVWGRRHEPFGIVNFPPEAAQIDRMLAARDRAIQAIVLPDARTVAANLVSGDDVWAEVPLAEGLPEDEWRPAAVEAKGAETSLGSTDILPPAEFAENFTLPDGYAIECFASEQDFPALANPLAMEFDARARLWVLCAPTYPHLLPGARPRCRLIVLEDRDRDGRADASTVFADGLYVPTGFALDTDAVYLGQAPDLLKLIDTDGDGRADRREIVFSGFGMCDSHHQLSAFAWDPWGGIVFHEGVFTRTNVETPTGTLRTRDAAVFRFDPLRGRLDVLSHCDFANPWGHVFDDFGASILADASGGDNHGFTHVCAPFEYPTKPNRPDPVLNRGRPTAGCEMIASRHFPADAQGTFLVNQSIGFHGTRWDRLRREGSTWAAERMPQDLLACSDVNFRPVACEVGPDGALYVLDWCNPIVGHMQYSVRDPRRDHAHGRVWRIRHRDRPLLEAPPVHDATVRELLELLRLPERNTRQLARRRLQRTDPSLLDPVLADWFAGIEADDPLRDRLALERLWILHAQRRAEAPDFAAVMQAKHPEVRAGAVRTLRQQIRAGEFELDPALALVDRAARDDAMPVRCEAVVTCGFLPPVEALPILESCETRAMDEPMRDVFGAVVSHLGRSSTIASPLLRRVRLASMDASALSAEPLDEVVAGAILVRGDVDQAARDAALRVLAGDDPGSRADVLLEFVSRTSDPSALAALANSLVGLPRSVCAERVPAATRLAQASMPARAAIGAALLLRGGAVARAFAGPRAALHALRWFEPTAVPPEVRERIAAAVDADRVESMPAVRQLVRIAGEAARDTLNRWRSLGTLPLDRWSADHERAVAALRGLAELGDASAPALADVLAVDRGRALYLDDAKGCARCHGDDGLGRPGFPPLDRSPWLHGDPRRAASIVVFGLYGPLDWPDGRRFQTAMAPLGSVLSNDEIADVLTFARQSWGNFAAPVDAAVVESARDDGPVGGAIWEVSALRDRYPLARDVVDGSPRPPQRR